MNQPLLLGLLAVSTYFYFHNPASPTSAGQPGGNVVAGQNWAVAAAPSSYNRWKTGPNAQTDLKTGPNAQTDLKTGPNAQTTFEPFAPNEQATWNQTPGYTIISGARVHY